MSKTELLPFDSVLNKDLFCLFILEGNSATYRELRYHPVNDSDHVESVAINEYELLYNDRSIAPENEGLTWQEFDTKLHSFRLKKFPRGWNYERDFIPHMKRSN